MGMRVLLVAFVLMPVLAQLPALAQDEFEVTRAPTTSQYDNAGYTCLDTQIGQVEVIYTLCGYMPDHCFGNRNRNSIQGVVLPQALPAPEAPPY